MNNEVTLQGRLAQEATLEESKNGTKYARGQIAVEHASGDKVRAVTYPFTMFGAAAERLAEYKKGAQIELQGRLDRSDYTSADGSEHTEFGIVGRKISQPETFGSKNIFKLSGFLQTSGANGTVPLKTAANGKTKYAQFGLSVKQDMFRQEGEAEKPAKYDTYFMTAFGNLAQNISSNFRRGDLCELMGRVDLDRTGAISMVATQGAVLREASSVQEGIAARKAPSAETARDRMDENKNTH